MNNILKPSNKISIVLPTYNEKDNVGPLIFEIQERLARRDYEIIVVDDDSPDKTWQVVEEIKRRDKRIHIVRRQGIRGLTSAIIEGIENSKGETVMWMDVDFSHHPKILTRLLDKIDQGYDIAVGSRYIPGGGMVIIEKGEDSLIAAILSFIMNFMIQKMLHPSFKDYTSGFIAVRREVLDAITLRGDYGEYFIDFIYRAIKTNCKIIEIPYISGSRKYGISKTGSNLFQYFRRGIKYIWTTIRLRLTRF